MLSAVDTATVATPKMATLHNRETRRPNRSPAMPATAPPIIIPSELSANTGANAPRSNRQSRMIEGIDTPSS